MTTGPKLVTADMLEDSIEFLDVKGQRVELAAVLHSQFLSCTKITHVESTFGVGPIVISIYDDIDSNAFSAALRLMEDFNWLQLRINRYISINGEQRLLRRNVLRNIQILSVTQDVRSYNGSEFPTIELEIACDDAIVQYGKDLDEKEP